MSRFNSFMVHVERYWMYQLTLLITVAAVLLNFLEYKHFGETGDMVSAAHAYRQVTERPTFVGVGRWTAKRVVFTSRANSADEKSDIFWKINQPSQLASGTELAWASNDPQASALGFVGVTPSTFFGNASNIAYSTARVKPLVLSYCERTIRIQVSN
jgi:hypothetical protein